jgi:hypothetical protein
MFRNPEDNTVSNFTEKPSIWRLINETLRSTIKNCARIGISSEEDFLEKAAEYMDIDTVVFLDSTPRPSLPR